MKIVNHVLQGAKFLKANASGGPLEPALIVLHDTAGRLEKGSSVNWLRSKGCKVSAHVVVELDGTVTQMVPFNRRAWHAGKSSFKGRVGCNGFSIGIELVNPGRLDARGKAWFGACGATEIKHCATPEHGDGYWMPHPPAQVEAVTAICKAIVEEYPRCNDITTHWEVSPGRKVDPNPLFPLDAVRRAVLDPSPDDEEDDDRPPAEPVKPPMSTGAKTGVAAGGVGAVAVGVEATKTVTGQTKSIVQDVKEVVPIPPASSFVYPALILAAALIGAVLVIRRRKDG